MDIKNNLNEIKKTLPEGVTLIAVSKTKPNEAILEAYECGIRDFGENKVQDLILKYEALPKDIRWHFIGALQTNKVRKLLGKTFLIQSLDRGSLADEINKIASKKNLLVDALIEVNIGEEDNKSGILLKDLEGFIEYLKNLEHINIKGLMAIIPQGDDAENKIYFRRMKEVFMELKHKENDRFHMEILSMGMSMDYLSAIEEGSTMVRVGTGIFGNRNNI
ncbi:MAG: YggS family pyridoxal phosphate-dependent enzyme [Clostridiaceae bacterium]